MKIRIVILYILATIPIYGQSQNIKQVYIFAGGINQKEMVHQQSIESQDVAAFGQAIYSGKKANYQYHLDIGFLQRFSDNEKRDYFYFGENTYIQLPFADFSFYFGRIIHPNYPAFLAWKDGSEGIAIKMTGEDWQVRLTVFDYYRGFPLLANFQYASKEVLTAKKGNRLRHSLSSSYQGYLGQLRFSLAYLNSYDWGSFSRDLPQETSGDRDFLYHIGFGYQQEISSFVFGGQFTLARGLDKVAYNPFFTGKSIPIVGELITLFGQYKGNDWGINFFCFLPDADKRNSQGQVLELGFVAMGSNPFTTKVLGQGLNFYPSAWVTQKGFEKTDAILHGRRNSFWTQMQIYFLYQKWKMILQYNYLLPIVLDGENSGGIEVQPAQYERFFLAEPAICLEYQQESKYSMQLEYSLLLSNKNQITRGQFLGFSAKAHF